MKAPLFVCFAFLLVLPALPQSNADSAPSGNPPRAAKVKKKAKRSPGGEIGSGASNVGAGVAKGAGNAAGGVAQGAVDLATLHPIAAGTAVGEGAAKAGVNVTVGTAKGAGKISRGVGRVFKKVF